MGSMLRWMSQVERRESCVLLIHSHLALQWRLLYLVTIAALATVLLRGLTEKQGIIVSPADRERSTEENELLRSEIENRDFLSDTFDIVFLQTLLCRRYV
jgi:hypothetical protein